MCRRPRSEEDDCNTDAAGEAILASELSGGLLDKSMEIKERYSFCRREGGERKDWEESHGVQDENEISVGWRKV
jgi:hypothetical protein